MFTEEFLTDLAQRLAIDCGITCDSYSEGGENFIDFHLINWAAPTKKSYKAIIDGFNALEVKKPLYSIYVSYDVSGFDYWMKNMQECQYGHLVVSLNESFSMDEYDTLAFDFNTALDALLDIQQDCALFTDCLISCQDFTEAKKMYIEALRVDKCINFYNK